MYLYLITINISSTVFYIKHYMSHLTVPCTMDFLGTL